MAANESRGVTTNSVLRPGDGLGDGGGYRPGPMVSLGHLLL